MTTYEEFLERTIVLDSGCRIPVSKRWPGRPLKVTHDGYMQVTVDGKPGRAHRIAWELANGPVPDGLTLDHLCRYRPCCEISHLEPVTMSENARRGDLPEIARAHLTRVSRIKRRCSECGLVSNPAGVALHQKASRHQGKEDLGLSDNVSYVAEQIESANVSADHYRVIFKPEAVVPDIDRP